MKIVELKLDETLTDFEIQDWIDNVFNKQYPEIEAKIKKGCNGTCGNANRIKELENDRHELLEKIKAIKEVLNIEEIYRLKKENADLIDKLNMQNQRLNELKKENEELKALNGLHEATIEGQLKDRVQVIKEYEYLKSVIADLLENGEMARQKALDVLSKE